MNDNVSQVLGEFETLVKEGKISSFWASVRKDELRIEATSGIAKRMIPLEKEMYESLSTFFYGIDKIEYRTHDYANLKCFVNARVMLDRLLKKD